MRDTLATGGRSNHSDKTISLWAANGYVLPKEHVFEDGLYDGRPQRYCIYCGVKEQDGTEGAET